MSGHRCDILLKILIRTTSLVLLEQAFVRFVRIPDDDGLGVGLLAFFTAVLVSIVWGGIDGYRTPFLRVATVWVVTGVLYGALGAALIQVGTPGAFDWSLMWDDVASLTPIAAQFTAVPAMLAAAVLSLVRPQEPNPAEVRRRRSALPR